MFKTTSIMKLSMTGTCLLVCTTFLSLIGCSEGRRCHTAYWRQVHYGTAYCAPCPPAWSASAPLTWGDGGQPTSWTRIEGDVYTQSYLDSLYRFQNGY